jgi:heptosyltransferase-3
MASAMRILLIKPKQIGDSLILTPTIRAIKLAHPEADIWVIVRKGCEGILAGCPDITRILTLAGVEKSDRQPGDVRRQIGVLLRLWAVKFDYVFELGDGHRGRLFAMLTRAKRRYSVKPDKPLKPVEAKRFNAISRFDWATCHRIEKDFYAVSEFLPLPKPVPPMIFEPEAMLPWAEGQTLQEYCVMQIGTRQGFNRWDREGWAKVGRAMLKRFENVVISCGPAAQEVEEAQWLQNQLGLRAMNTRGETSWPEMAWLLHRAKLYIGPNTAAMHLAAACRCPTVALFGPSIEDHWYPWQVPYRIATTPGYVAAQNPVERYGRVKKRSMQEIQARDVVAACDALMEEVGTPRAPQGVDD